MESGRVLVRMLNGSAMYLDDLSPEASVSKMKRRLGNLVGAPVSGLKLLEEGGAPTLDPDGEAEYIDFTTHKKFLRPSREKIIQA